MQSNNKDMRLEAIISQNYFAEYHRLHLSTDKSIKTIRQITGRRCLDTGIGRKYNAYI